MQYRPDFLKVSVFFNIVFAVIISLYYFLPSHATTRGAAQSTDIISGSATASSSLSTIPDASALSRIDKRIADPASVLGSAISRVSLLTMEDDVDVYLYPISEKTYISYEWCGGKDGKPIHDGEFALYATRQEDGKIIPVAQLQLSGRRMFAEGTIHDGLKQVIWGGDDGDNDDKFVALNKYGSCNGEYVELYEFAGNQLKLVDFIMSDGTRKQSIPSFMGKDGTFHINRNIIETSSYDPDTGKYEYETYRYDGQNFVSVIQNNK